MSTADTTSSRTAAILVAIAPAALLAAVLIHPFLAVPGPEVVGALVPEGTTRWAVAHLTTAAASGFVAVAFAAVHTRLLTTGQRTASAWGLPFVIFGSVLYGFLPGLEFAPWAAFQTGGDPAVVFSALQPWFVVPFVTSGVTFAIGVAGFVLAFRASDVLSSGTTNVVVAGLVVMAIARAAPLGILQFHVQGVAAVVALWPLALEIWRQPLPHPAVPSRGPMAAT